MKFLRILLLANSILLISNFGFAQATSSETQAGTTLVHTNGSPGCCNANTFQGELVNGPTYPHLLPSTAPSAPPAIVPSGSSSGTDTNQ